MIDIRAVNSMDRDRFVATLGAMFEPWPLGRGTDLAQAPLRGRCRAASRDDCGCPLGDRRGQVELLRAHPELAGKAARTGVIMADSRSEQDGIGLDQLDEAESGRTDQPLLAGEAMAAGRTRIVFHVDEYVARLGVPVEFAIGDARAHYQLLLLVTAWNYTTYCGS